MSNHVRDVCSVCGGTWDDEHSWFCGGNSKPERVSLMRAEDVMPFNEQLDDPGETP